MHILSLIYFGIIVTENFGETIWSVHRYPEIGVQLGATQSLQEKNPITYSEDILRIIHFRV